MLTRTVLGRLATELSRTRPCDVTHLSQRLNSLRNTLNGIIPSPRRLVRGAQPFHTSIQYLASRGTNTTRKTGRTSVRKTASKRAPTKKTTTGKRSGVRRKAASKAKKRPTKRVPSEKAKLKLAAQKKRDEITGLKETALLSSEPKTSPTSAWSVLITEYVRGEKGSVNTRFKEAATKFRDLSPSEREHYNHLANENKSAFASQYQQWVQSHTAEQIRQANIARNALRRKLTVTTPNPGHKRLPKFRGRIIRLIKDDRAVKRPVSTYTLFSQDRHRSGDMKSVPIGEAGKLIASEWKALTPAEKENYQQRYEEEFARYEREYKDVYGHDHTKRPRKAMKTS